MTGPGYLDDNTGRSPKMVLTRRGLLQAPSEYTTNSIACWGTQTVETKDAPTSPKSSKQPTSDCLAKYEPSESRLDDGTPYGLTHDTTRQPPTACQTLRWLTSLLACLSCDHEKGGKLSEHRAGTQPAIITHDHVFLLQVK